MKRLPISGFGEGNVVKRPRNDVQEKPKSSDGRPPPIARAILSGPDSGFRVKPVSLPAGGQKQPRPPPLPSNPDEALATFKKSSSNSTCDVRRPPFPLPRDDSPFNELQKKLGRRPESPANKDVKRNNDLLTPFANRIRPPELRAERPNPVTPARKVMSFLALPVPMSIPDETPAESSAAPSKRPPFPKFDLGGVGGKGKLMVMTALEPPMVELPEEKEVVGEALELQRGLLVSPQKGDRKRGRFIRNGLAECAQMLMDRSSTALVLWRKEIESLSHRPNRLNADLRLRVKEVVHVSRNANVHSRAAGALRTVLATCTILPNGEERSVLLSFANDEHRFHAPGSASPPALGSEILIWKPWQETKDPPVLFCFRFLVLSDSS
ncbi:hypothetical protein ACEPAF_8805 [Sanghuangporus sanghuang]|uniref:Uncharacterized protein n=1 Tax=Sanghuangporus baumii TaxID=108892 RepID=A0A9Q5HYB9_SANBA|nr:hypothetical protein A7U60_g4925 [Sanghuangporus baumii]